MFIEKEGGEEEEEVVNEEEAEKKEIYFDWYAEYGLNKSISLIRKDFNKFRGLDQVKILISGPLATGKTLMAQKLSQS